MRLGLLALAFLSAGIAHAGETRTSAHFTAELRGHAPADTLPRVLVAAERARDRVHREAGVAGPATTHIVVHGAGVSAPATGGEFDGSIHLALGGDAPDSRAAEDRLAHEYAHALVDHVSSGRAPRWLDEGLAMALEGRGREGAQTRLATAKHHGRLALVTRSDGVWSEDRDLAYDQAFAAIRLLESRYGRHRLLDLVQQLSRGGDFRRTFEAVFARSLERFEEDLRESI